MSRGRQLVSRMRTRLFGGAAEAPVGQAWSASLAQEWEELSEGVDGALKRPGTAAVSTWEVCAADLARVVIGEPGEKALLERFSDALVPTLDALQAPHKALPGALAEGKKAGEAAGTLAAATRPLVLLPHGLDVAIPEGWAKTVAFLEPIVVAAADPAAARAALAAAGPKLAAGAREAEASLRDTLSRLPQATELEEGVVEPFDGWAQTLGRAIEIELWQAAHGLIRALR